MIYVKELIETKIAVFFRKLRGSFKQQNSFKHSQNLSARMLSRKLITFINPLKISYLNYKIQKNE